MDKGPEPSGASKASKSRKMWAKGVNAIRKEAAEEGTSGAANGTTANGEGFKAGALANEAQAGEHAYPSVLLVSVGCALQLSSSSFLCCL